MKIDDAFKTLRTFLIAWFSDPDTDQIDDRDLVNNYVSVSGKDRLKALLIEIQMVNSEIGSCWESVGDLANRHFSNSTDAFAWLKQIEKYLIEAIERKMN